MGRKTHGRLGWGKGKSVITEHLSSEGHRKQACSILDSSLGPDGRTVLEFSFSMNEKNKLFSLDIDFIHFFSQFLRFSRDIHTVFIFGSSVLKTHFKISFQTSL